MFLRPAAAIFSLILGHAAAAAEVPDGWRYLNKTELADPLRKESQSRFSRANADFNADGSADHAVLLRSIKSQKEALWVNLSKSEARTWVKLAEFDAKPGIDSGMAVDLAAPGVYPYGCFDTAKTCDFPAREERPKLRLRAPSLIYYKLESASSLFFWSRSKKEFLRVWLSD